MVTVYTRFDTDKVGAMRIALLFSGLVLYVVAKVPTLQSSCDPEVLYVCSNNVTALHDTYTTTPPASILQDCQKCNEDDCETPLPSSGIKGSPLQSSCTLCGDPTDLRMIGQDYTIHVRENCMSIAMCSGEVSLSRPVVLSNRGFIKLIGRDNNPIVTSQCPAFVLQNMEGIEIENINITCLGVAPGYENQSPGILIENSESLLLNVKSLAVSGAVLSSLVVMGGNFDVLPVIRTTIMNGSVVSNVVISDSSYPNPVAVTMSDFTGIVHVDGMPPFSRLLVAPSKGGNVSYTPKEKHLDVINPSTLTNIFGTPYESEYVSKSDLYGYTSTDINNTGKQSLVILTFIFLGLVRAPPLPRRAIGFDTLTSPRPPCRL